MSRFARNGRVYFVEEPIFSGVEIQLTCSICSRTGVRVVTPVLPEGTTKHTVPELLRELIQELIYDEGIRDWVAWYYTPMAMEFTDHLTPKLTVYDCMDELAAFANAPARMIQNEELLFETADLVFTGGASLYEAKRARHPQVHLFPSSVDQDHFSKATTKQVEPQDQRPIPHPRIGYVGVIDERMDLELIAYLADQRPAWQIVLLGPLAKIDPDSLPRRSNIHYLGMKKYDELPGYLSGWDVALLPFAQNASTQYISPTKTPEYLAAGLPVVSTPIHDVVCPYGELGLVFIGDSHDHFLQGIECQLSEGRNALWRSEVKVFLSSHSWDKTWEGMQRLVAQELVGQQRDYDEDANDSEAASLTQEASAVHV